MKRPLSLRVRVLGGLAALVLLAGGFVAYKVANPGAPSFRRGGDFGAFAGDRSTPTGTPSPSIESSTTTTVAAAPPPEAATATSATTATTRPPATQPKTTATTARPATTATSASAPPSSAAATAPPPPAPAGPNLPGVGTYTYAVDGQETASFFGTRRFPNEMTTVVHGASGLAPDQLVFDLRYSDQHEEREIVGFRGDGIYFDYEAGSVTFGPRTETSEADYEPPMLQIPRPLQPGVTRTGVSTAKTSSGSAARTEDWKVAVLGKEAVTVAGATVEAWKVQVDRKTRPGSGESLTRSRTYWYDPGRAMWVKFTETLHAERNQATFSFTYDSRVTATLLHFAPA